MSTVLELDLEALARLSPQLHLLAGLLKGFGDPSLQAPVATESDMPSLVAARAATVVSLPALEETVADRFTVVADLVEQARIRFKSCSEELTAVITSAGDLRPPAVPAG